MERLLKNLCPISNNSLCIGSTFYAQTVTMDVGGTATTSDYLHTIIDSLSLKEGEEK